MNRQVFAIPLPLKIPFLICILVSCSITLAVLVAYFTIQPQVPLFYSLAQPSQQLAAKEWLFLFPFMSFMISGIHLSLARMLYRQTRTIISLFTWTTVALQVVLALSLSRILFIVT